jgi:hypothetical protein
MGKSRRRRQDVVLLTETNSVDEFHLEAFVAHAESPETVEAWLLDSTQQAIDEKSGRYLQAISSRSGLPLKIYHNKDNVENKEGVHGNISALAAQTEDEEMVFLDGRQGKDGRLLWVGIALAGVVLTLLIAVLMILKSRM